MLVYVEPVGVLEVVFPSVHCWPDSTFWIEQTTLAPRY